METYRPDGWKQGAQLGVNPQQGFQNLLFIKTPTALGPLWMQCFKGPRKNKGFTN